MNTNLQIKTFKDSVSLEVQESKQIFNRNGSLTTSAHTITNRKERCGEKINNSIKETGKGKGSTKRNNTAPRVVVSIEFAAKQLFQILLVDIKGRNARLNGELVPVPFAGI